MATLEATLRYEPPDTAAPAPAPERIFSLDAFRGFTMVCLVADGFGLHFFKDHPIFGPIGAQFDHVDWQGMHAWDLVQPFFMFIVGAVMPASFGRRWRLGETWASSFLHVFRRSALLILCGLFARSVQAGKPTLDVINVLAQVAFTYLVAFLVVRRSWKAQAATAFGCLAAHWALYQFATAPGVQGPWVKDANIGWYLDRLILGKNWSGSYATINCLSSAANTIFGVMAGALIVSELPDKRKLQMLIAPGVAAILAGLALDPLIPIVKKIWTASFAIYSTGYTLLALALFYWLCDVRRWQRWAKLFVIVGSNSIFIYMLHEVLRSWLTRTGLVFTAWTVDLWGPLGRMLNAWLVIAFQLYVCVWLYRRKIFFKL